MFLIGSCPDEGASVGIGGADLAKHIWSFCARCRGAMRPVGPEGATLGLLALLGAWLVNIVPAAVLAGEVYFFALLFWCVVAGGLSLLTFPLALPILPYHHVATGRTFPFLTASYLWVVAYSLCVAAVLAFGDLNRFVFLAVLGQCLALATTIFLLMLKKRQTSCSNEPGAGVGRRYPVFILLILAFVVVVGAAMPFAVWLPAAHFLKTDACLDAGGRMGAGGVCEYGASGLN